MPSILPETGQRPVKSTLPTRQRVCFFQTTSIVDEAAIDRALQITTPDCNSSAPPPQKPRQFINLPAEIRTKVYEELLLASKAHRRTLNPVFDNTPYTRRPYTRIGCNSTLQGVSLWTVRYEFTPAILRVNRQIYAEAWQILYERNNWIQVTVNISTFSTQLKAAGFGVVAAGPAGLIAQVIKRLGLKFAVTYPGMEAAEADDCLWPWTGLPALVRALSLFPGYASPIVPPGAEFKLVSFKYFGRPAFFDIPVRKHEFLDALNLTGEFEDPKMQQPTMHTADLVPGALVRLWNDSHGLGQRIATAANISTAALKTHSWHEAHEQALTALGILDVFNKGDYEALPLHEGFEMISLENTMVGICLSNIALARLKLGDPEGAVEKVTQAMPLLRLVGQAKSVAFLRRGMAYKAMGKPREAAEGFLDAVEYGSNVESEAMAVVKHLMLNGDPGDRAVRMALLANLRGMGPGF